MAALPRCSVCEYCDIFEHICSYYPFGIPDAVFCEVKECAHFLHERQKDKDVIILANAR